MADAGANEEEVEQRAWPAVHALIDSIPITVKELLAGGVSGGVAKSAVAPLDRIKILFQTRRSEFQSVGLVGSFKKIVQTEGVSGFYKGNGASVVRIVPYAALHYMAYEEYRRWIMLAFPDAGKGPAIDLVAGSIAGGTAVVFTYPLDLVRTRLAYQIDVKSANANLSELYYKGIGDCFLKIYRNNGMRGLYKGAAPTLYGIFPYSGLKFYFYEGMKNFVPEEHRRDIGVNLFCGSVAGLVGQTMTYPLDVVRRLMQIQNPSGSNSGQKSLNTIEIMVMIAREHGWKQLFSGLSINYLRVVPSVAIGFAVYESMKSWLKIPSRHDKR